MAKSNVPRAPASGISAAVRDGAATANNAFAVDLFGRLRSSAPPGNLLTAPYTASIALTMTYAGAGGDTATQMATALHFGSAAPTIFDGQNALSQAIESRGAAALAQAQATAKSHGQPAPSPSDYEVQAINSVWGEQSLTWVPAFLDVLAGSYGTGVYLEDFKNHSSDAVADINGWVLAATSGKIGGLIPALAVTDQTRMVLVDAMHIKLPWASPFETWATAAATFTRSDASTVTPKFMNATSTRSYVDDGQAQIVALPLAGGQISVIITLPHGDLATYEAGLTAGSAGIAQPTTTELVALSLPKFDFTSASFSLSEALKAMGMTRAFEVNQADFSGLCANPDGFLYVSSVWQKATMSVQETGVEAAGATAVVVSVDASIGPDAAPPTPIPMVVDRPFLVSIVDVPTGAVLFLGHVEDPTQTGP
jgi:serpin B